MRFQGQRREMSCKSKKINKYKKYARFLLKWLIHNLWKKPVIWRVEAALTKSANFYTSKKQGGKNGLNIYVGYFISLAGTACSPPVSHHPDPATPPDGEWNKAQDTLVKAPIRNPLSCLCRYILRACCCIVRATGHKDGVFESCRQLGKPLVALV